MQFGLIRFIDQVLGRILLYTLAPVCRLADYFLTPKPVRERKVFSFIKLHGGGSLLIALPSLLGIRKKYPQTVLTLICTAETQKYAELTGLFDDYVIIDQQNPLTLATSGLKALAKCFRHDVCIDLEPHSFLAAVFCLSTFSVRRLGLVKPHELYRAKAYTDALYFNLFAPVHIFYEQLAGLLDAAPVSDSECKETVRAHIHNGPSPLEGEQTKPVVYVSAFASGLAPERMMPVEVWIAQLQQKFGAASLTLVIGGTADDVAGAQKMQARFAGALPAAKIVNLCGTRSLKQTAQDIGKADAFWGVDSGLLHIARLLNNRCKSYWGPTNPAALLKKISGLEEEVVYLGFPCSPCVHVTLKSPCGGDNQCLKSLLAPRPTPPPIRLNSSR
jgi:ADP-heptose:LPS heptosyltransferase